jgi:hypothetical protein
MGRMVMLYPTCPALMDRSVICLRDAFDCIHGALSNQRQIPWSRSNLMLFQYNDQRQVRYARCRQKRSSNKGPDRSRPF